MTGYENLEYELSKEFNTQKVQSNQAFIQAIVRILTENTEDKIALEMAEKSRKEAEDTLLIAQQEKEQADYRNMEIQRKLTAITLKEKEVKEIESHIEEIRANIEKCETSEARDKMRLAEYFCKYCRRELDGVAYVRGLSNILGNGGNKTASNDRVILNDKDLIEVI